MPEGTDGEILGRFSSGDTAAFAGLYRKYYRRVFAYCHRLVGNRESAEDIVQSVFAKAMESAAALKKPESFSFWLFTIARNEVYATFRAAKKVGTAELDDEVWDSDSPLERVVQNETSELVEEAFSRLKPEYREVLVLRHFEKLSYVEIASLTGATVSSVESRLFKARKALIKVLEPVVRERGVS